MSNPERVIKEVKAALHKRKAELAQLQKQYERAQHKLMLLSSAIHAAKDETGDIRSGLLDRAIELMAEMDAGRDPLTITSNEMTML
jgi:chromosome segregation ATPase